MKSRFTEEEQEFIKNNVKGRTVQELTEMFNQQFKRNITAQSIRNYKKSKGLTSGINTKFKAYERPHNYKPIGSEFVNDEGYTFIKVTDPNTWKLKHRYIYESTYGSIPTDCSVIFADSDKTNFDIDNLMLVKRKNKLVAKNKHLIFEDKELTKTGMLIAELITKSSEKRKANEK